MTSQTIFALVRATHLLACILAAGLWAFDRLVLPAGGRVREESRSPRRAVIVCLLIVLLTGAAWFALVTAAMSGQSPTWRTLQLVWSKTTFGHVWQLRGVVWIATLVLTALATGRLRQIAGWLALLSAGVLLASLAWAGHGQIGGQVHLIADAIHLLAASLWPGGLVPLSLVLWRVRHRREKWGDLAKLVSRFSGVSILAVSLLLASGVVNSCYLLPSVGSLLRWPYGVWLSVKIGLSLLAIALGATNLLHWRPKLTRGAAPAMLKTVAIEVLLMIAIVAIVGLLGLLPPPT